MSTENTLFRRDPSYSAAVILFLVENSSSVLSEWEELRAQHLEPLLSHFEKANSDVPIKVITLESSPLEGQVPREYTSSNGGLRGLRFNTTTHPNKLTIDKIERAVELLGSFKFKGNPVASNLIIVAATDPCPEDSPGVKQYPWFLVAQKLVGYGIFCHLALVKAGDDLSAFVGMFQKGMLLQGSNEVVAPFGEYDKAKFVFHFCAPKDAQMSKSYRRSTTDSPPQPHAQSSRRLSFQGIPASDSRMAARYNNMLQGAQLQKPGTFHTSPTAPKRDLDASLQFLRGKSGSPFASQSAKFPSTRELELGQPLRIYGAGTGNNATVADGGRRPSLDGYQPGHGQSQSPVSISPESLTLNLVKYLGSGTIGRATDLNVPGPASPSSPSLVGESPQPGYRMARNPQTRIQTTATPSISLIDELLSPGTDESPSDLEADSEPFWLEGRALEEAVTRYGPGASRSHTRPN